MGYFSTFYLPNSPKNQNLEKGKKTLEISFYNSALKIIIICYTVPEIWCMTNVIIFHFWAIFCPFTPLTAQKIEILKKWKKKHGDIIILHMCTKTYDQMMYSSWDMVHDRCNCYFSFWAIFCPFTPLPAQKIKILKKWKKHLDISFYICVSKIMIRCCTVPEIWCTTEDRQTDRWTDKQK